MRDSRRAWTEMEESGLDEEWNGCGRKARAEEKGGKSGTGAEKTS